MYKYLANGYIYRDTDNATIPPDPMNRDYQVVLAWVAAGNVIAPADPPPPPSSDDLDAATAIQYAKLRALASMSQAEIDAWVTANVTNLAGAQDAIKTLAKGVQLLLRREYGSSVRN